MRHVEAVVLGLLLASGSLGCQARDCADTRAEARKLVSEAQVCSAGDDCVVVDYSELAGANNCLGPFQCGGAVRMGVDLDDLGRRAKAIADDYQQCKECETALCADPATLTASCNAAAGRCELGTP